MVLVEVDGGDELVEAVGLELPVTVTARSRRGLHRYYRPDNGMKPGKFQIDAGGVSGWEDGYLVTAPALNESGHVYEFIQNGAIAVLPADAHQRLLAAAQATERRVDELVHEGGKIPEGHRDRVIFLRALEMAHAGLTEDQILPSMLALGRDGCDPPLADDLVRKQVRGAVRRAKKKPAPNRELRREAEAALVAALDPAQETAGVAVSVERSGITTSRCRLQRTQVTLVVPRRQRWLMRGVPLGAPTVLAGIGGLGKSMLVSQWLARLTRGELDADGAALVVSFEDATAEVIRPRLEVAGANLDRCYVVGKDEGIVTLPDDLAELERLAQETEARLLAIDPFSAALSLKLDAHRDQDVRVVLGRLEKLAAKHDLAVVLVMHLNKQPTTEAYIRISGSPAFYNGARSVITVTPDPDDEDCRLVAQHKANYARLIPVQRHRIEPAAYDYAGETILTARMVYVEDAEDVDPYAVLEQPTSRSLTKQDRASTLLLALLADGEWHERDELARLVESQGVSERTFKRAAEQLDIESELRGFPAKAHWRLAVGPTPIHQELAQLDKPA
jgi:hypothetical protein